MKVKEWLRRLCLPEKDILKEYRVTMLGVLLFTLYGVLMSILPLNNTAEFFLISYENEICNALLLFFAGALLVETYFKGSMEEASSNYRFRRMVGDRVGKICGYGCACFLACLLTFLGNLNGLEAQGQLWKGIVAEWAGRCSVGYVMLLFAGAFYGSFRSAGMAFEEYVLRVFANFLKTGIVYMILNIGVSIVVGIFHVLILNNGMSLDIACMILITGLYLIPRGIISLSDLRGEPGSLACTIAKYVLPLLSMGAFAIVYLYVLKLVLLREMPSNEIFPIVSSLFCLGLPVWVMADYYRDDTRYTRFISRMPYAFAPLICLQVYSIGMRIIQYGMTPKRYMGVMLIVFEAGALFIWHFRKGRREKIWKFLCVLIAISVFVPFLNMYQVSDVWQLSFLKKYYSAAEAGKELSHLDMERLTGSWNYLKQQQSMKETLKKYDIFDAQFLEEIKTPEGEEIDLTQLHTYHVHCCQMVGEVDISSYKKMLIIDQDETYARSGESIENVDFTKFTCVVRGTGDKVTVDIQDFVDQCLDYEREHPDAEKEEISQAMKAYQEIRLADGSVLLVDHFEVTYKEGVKDGKEYLAWQRIDVKGMVYQK